MRNAASCARGLLRFALGASFLSAVVSRLGLWGAHAGRLADAFAGFRDSVAELNPWLPPVAVPIVAVVVTTLEGTIGAALLAGYRTRLAATAAGALLTAFALAMSVFTGPKSALDYSVWSAAMGAFVLAAGARVELDHVTLEVADPVAAAGFFDSLFGFQPVRLADYREGRAPFPSVRVGEGTLIDLFPQRLWRGDKPQNPNHLCFTLSAADLGRLRRRLSERGVAVIKTDEHNFGARGFGHALYFHGPEEALFEARRYSAGLSVLHSIRQALALCLVL